LDGGAYQIREAGEASADQAGSAAVIGQLIGPPIEIRPTRDRREWLSLAVAIAAHLAILALLIPRTAEAPGDDGVALEAIAVSLIDSQALISAPQATPSEPSEAPTEDAAEPAPPEQASVQVEAQKQPDPTEEPVPQEVSPLPAPPQQTAKEETKKPDEPPAEKQTAQTPPPAAAPPVLPSQTIAEAAPGVVRAYASSISKLLDRGKPKSHRIKGEVVVNFVIDARGRSEPPVITRSSGNSQLDDLVIAAIQRMDFPTPPPEMSLRQRTFIVPFRFR
jgi:protein TonB